jgi:hypothetical protein
MQDLEQAKAGLELQKKLYERFDLLNGIEKCVPSEIVCEMNSWTEPITKNQPEPFTSNMRGKKLSGINYISKLLSDFFLDGELFKKVYEPHPLRPFLNYLLQKKLEVTDHYFFSSSSSSSLPQGDKGTQGDKETQGDKGDDKETQDEYAEGKKERLFLIKVLSLANNILKKKIIIKMYNLKDKKNFAIYSLNNYIEKKKVVDFEKAIEILKNPLANPYCTLSLSSFPSSSFPSLMEKEEKKEERYVEHLVPDAQLSSTFLSGLKTIYFL